MRNMRTLRISRVAFIVGLLTACESTGGSSSGGGSTSGGTAGASCIDYTSCAPGLYCFVSTDAVEGKCETAPSECGTGSFDCSCLGDAVATKCASKGSCAARVDRAVYSCPATVKKKEGEPCSVARGCEGGLYCKVSTVTRVGTCEKLPAGCGSKAACSCLGAEGCGAGTVRECSIFGDEASLVCE